jgi:hypothetical protein
MILLCLTANIFTYQGNFNLICPYLLFTHYSVATSTLFVMLFYLIPDDCTYKGAEVYTFSSIAGSEI